MTDVLHLPARPGAPIACDMSTATDTPDQRLAEYRGLFARALVRRERREHAVAFAFRDLPGVRAQVDDLARREAACCPFLDYRVETVAGEVVYTLADPGHDPQVDAMLDAFSALPESPGYRTVIASGEPTPPKRSHSAAAALSAAAGSSS